VAVVVAGGALVLTSAITTTSTTAKTTHTATRDILELRLRIEETTATGHLAGMMSVVPVTVVVEVVVAMPMIESSDNRIAGTLGTRMTTMVIDVGTTTMITTMAAEVKMTAVMAAGSAAMACRKAAIKITEEEGKVKRVKNPRSTCLVNARATGQATRLQMVPTRTWATS